VYTNYGLDLNGLLSKGCWRPQNRTFFVDISFLLCFNWTFRVFLPLYLIPHHLSYHLYPHSTFCSLSTQLLVSNV
jgi:hypothetical protein